MGTNHNLVVSTAVGTLLSVSCFGLDDLVKSAVLGAVGATASFSISLLLRFLLKTFRAHFRK